MTAEECRRRALSLAGIPPEWEMVANAAIEKWMAPYRDRNAAVDPGTVLVDEVDPETFGHRTVEKQLHPARQVRPFVFGPAEVQDLARHIRRELRLK